MWNASSPYAAYAPLFPSPLPESRYPIYSSHRQQLVPGLSDGITLLVAPIIVYWSFSLMFHFIDNLGWDCFERYRIHEPDELKRKNRVSVAQVIRAVIIQQIIQTATGWIFVIGVEEPPLDAAGDLNAWGMRVAHVVLSIAGTKRGGEFVARYGQQTAEWIYWWGVPTLQMVIAA